VGCLLALLLPALFGQAAAAEMLSNLLLASLGGAEHVPADAAESVDPNANCHSLPPEAKMNDAGLQESLLRGPA